MAEIYARRFEARNLEDIRESAKDSFLAGNLTGREYRDAIDALKGTERTMQITGSGYTDCAGSETVDRILERAKERESLQFNIDITVDTAREGVITIRERDDVITDLQRKLRHSLDGI